MLSIRVEPVCANDEGLERAIQVAGLASLSLGVVAISGGVLGVSGFGRGLAAAGSVCCGLVAWTGVEII